MNQNLQLNSFIYEVHLNNQRHIYNSNPKLYYDVLVCFLLTVKYDIAKLCNVSKENSKFYYGKKIDAFWCLDCMALTKIDAKNLLACTNKSSNTNMTLVSC